MFQIFRSNKRARLSGRCSLLGGLARGVHHGQPEVRPPDQVAQDPQEGEVGDGQELHSQPIVLLSGQHQGFHPFPEHK